MPIKIVPADKGRRHRNTKRENRLEELGRVDAEKAYTRKGQRNLREEKSRIRKELATGGSAAQNPMDTGRDRSADFNAKRKFRDRLKKLTEKGKQSPGRPGGKGPKSDKRWNKGDKFMTPLKRKKYNIGGRANLLEEMGRIDARRHPDRADRAEKRRVIGELNKGYKSGGRSVKRIGSTQQGADEGATGTTRTRAQIEKYHKRSERPKHKQPLRIKKFARGGAVLKGKKVGCQIK